MASKDRIDPISQTPLVDKNGKATLFFAVQWNKLVNVARTALKAAQDALDAQTKVNTLESRKIDTAGGLQGGGDLSADRTLSLTDTGVVAGSYTSTDLTVDSKGRITAAANGAGGGGGGGSDPFFSPPSAAQFPIFLTNGTGPFTENEFADVPGLGLAFRGTLRNSTPTSMLRVKAMPAPPWTITTRYTLQYTAKKIVLCGLALRDSSDNEMEWFGVLTDSTSGAPQLRIYRVTGTTVNSVPLTTNAALLFGHLYLRVSLDGSGNLLYTWSSDGHNFETALTTTLGAFIDNIDQAGFFFAKFSSGGADTTYSMMVSYYDEGGGAGAIILSTSGDVEEVLVSGGLDSLAISGAP